MGEDHGSVVDLQGMLHDQAQPPYRPLMTDAPSAGPSGRVVASGRGLRPGRPKEVAPAAPGSVPGVASKPTKRKEQKPPKPLVVDHVQLASRANDLLQHHARHERQMQSDLLARWHKLSAEYELVER